MPVRELADAYTVASYRCPDRGWRKALHGPSEDLMRVSSNLGFRWASREGPRARPFDSILAGRGLQNVDCTSRTTPVIGWRHPTRGRC